MIGAITLLLACQLAGEIIVAFLHLPVPGPVVGMALLFLGLTLRGQVPAPLDRVCRALLGNLSLLFVPAGAGIMLHFHLLAQQWVPIAAALVGGTLLAIMVTGLVMHRLTRNGRQP